MFTPTRLPGTPTTIVAHVDGEAERAASGPAGLQVVEQLVGDVQVAETGADDEVGLAIRP